MRVERSERYRRQGVALVIAILLIAMLAALSAQLATMSSTRAIIASRRSNDLQHRLAVDSALDTLAEAIDNQDDFSGQFTHHDYLDVSFELNDCMVDMTIRDDGAKFNMKAYQDDKVMPILENKLQELGRVMRLPDMKIDLRPRLVNKKQLSPMSDEKEPIGMNRFSSFDQLFAEPQSPQIFHWETDTPDHRKDPVWSDYLTMYGDGRLDIRHAEPNLVELALSDVNPGLAISATNQPALEKALEGLDDAIRPKVATRIGYGLNRYALTIRTAIESDVRQWYVVATFDEGMVRIHHRQQITW